MGGSLKKHLVMSAGGNGFKVVTLFILITLLWNKANIVGILCKRVINETCLRKRLSAASYFCNGMIKTLGHHLMPGLHDFFLGLFVKCKHHNTACIAVQPVNNKGLMFSICQPLLSKKFLQNRLCRTRLTSRIWNRKHSARFINHSNPLIMKKQFNLFPPKISLMRSLKFCRSLNHTRHCSTLFPVSIHK